MAVDLVKFASAHEILAEHGHSELHFGHASVVDRERGHVWIKRGDTSFAKATAEDIIAVNFDGVPVNDPGPCHSEVWLHISIYRARHDVSSVVHSHAPLLAAYSAVEPRWPVIDQYSLEMSQGLVWYESSQLIATRDRGSALADCLGSNRTCFLRAHGALVADDSLESAVVGMVELGASVRNILWATAFGEVRGMNASDQALLADRFRERKSSRVQNMWNQLL